MATPIKPFKRFAVAIVEVDQNGRPISLDVQDTIEANGNPELFAKVGSFIRQFSKDHIYDWRQRL